MAAPAVAPTGAAQVAEPMIIIEPEKKSAEKRSHDNLNDPEIDAAAKRGALAQLQPTAVIPAHAQEIIPISQDAGVGLRAEPSIAINIPPAQRNLLEELQGVDMTATAFPQPPQQDLQLQGPTDLSELAASAARAQADKQAQPPGLLQSATSTAAAGKEGCMTHTRPGREGVERRGKQASRAARDGC
jgi:hypothetical protein